MDNFSHNDQYFMRRALELAALSADQGEVPVGAVLVCDDKIVGEGINQSIRTSDPTAHAEMVALRAGGKELKNYRLINSTLYVTLEPCLMCVYAMIHARIARCVFAATDPKTGALGGCIDTLQLVHWNHTFLVSQGLFAEESKTLLRRFFQERR